MQLCPSMTLFNNNVTVIKELWVFLLSKRRWLEKASPLCCKCCQPCQSMTLQLQCYSFIKSSLLLMSLYRHWLTKLFCPSTTFQLPELGLTWLHKHLYMQDCGILPQLNSAQLSSAQLATEPCTSWATSNIRNKHLSIVHIQNSAKLSVTLLWWYLPYDAADFHSFELCEKPQV